MRRTMAEERAGPHRRRVLATTIYFGLKSDAFRTASAVGNGAEESFNVSFEGENYVWRRALPAHAEKRACKKNA